MNKYIITSPRFTGEINVLYGLDGKLLFIDFLKCDLSEEQTDYFKRNCPVKITGEKVIDYMTSCFGSSKLTIIEEGYKVTFDMMWDRYDYKVNRIRAEKEWNKLGEAHQVNAFARYPLYDRHLKLNAWKTKAGLDRYLKERFWESEWK
jgi:hypothetical protein